jgi:hypothetical protein
MRCGRLPVLGWLSRPVCSERRPRPNAINAVADGTGHAMFATKLNATGHCLLGTHDSTVSGYAAIAGVTKGAGPGLYGRGEGSGLGVWGQIADAASPRVPVEGLLVALDATSGIWAFFPLKTPPRPRIELPSIAAPAPSVVPSTALCDFVCSWIPQDGSGIAK